MGKKPAQQEPKPSLETMENRVRGVQEAIAKAEYYTAAAKHGLDLIISDINTLRIEEAMRNAK